VWLAYVFVYQQAENYLIEPVVYHRTVQVNPLGISCTAAAAWR
jgi:predicted PurR-regulated permease PerM